MQQPFLALIITLGLPLPAQDKPRAAADLPQLGAAFARLQATEPTIAIACQAGAEPVILTAGREAGGNELTPRSLLPLLGLGKLLAADAIAAQQRDKLDKGSGQKLGGRELSVRELLEGTLLLPDYFVLDGGDGSADAAVLRACGDLAASARLQMRATTLGAAEFVLLEPLAFAGRYRDWPSMVRSILAPRVPGLDPVSVDALPESMRSRLAFDPQDVAKLAVARPALLRTVLSLQDLSTWWQWRVQQGTLWTGARMGRAGRALTRPDEQRWSFSATAMNCSILAGQYPTQKAGILLIGPARIADRTGTMVLQAFDADLFGSPVAKATAAERRMAVAGAAAVFVPAPENTLNMGLLTGSRWRGDDGTACAIAFGARSWDPLVFTLDHGATPFQLMSRAGDSFTANARIDDGTQRSLWLWPHLDDARQTTRLGAVLVSTRGATVGASVPQCVYLLPEAK